MSDNIFWGYLEKLPEQEDAWKEWQSGLTGWHRFNTFYTHYLRVEGRRAKELNCTAPCELGYPRRIIENSPSNITAVCPQNKADPIQLKFRDILIYALRRETLHKALCISLKITYSGESQLEYGDAWHLGDYSGTEVYLTYKTSTLTDTISSIYLLHQKPFILMVPTVKNITPEIQQFMTNNNSILLFMEAELSLQPDGSFKPVRSISECMKTSNEPCPQRYRSKILPIEAYKYLAY
ncbi:MAG: hypothetical protein WCV67_18660 [Victivallaceae bacterium]|jgi:hypothetical protein